MNKVQIVGRLTKDPELKYAPGGMAIGNFTVAINRKVGKDKPKETDFIPVVVFGKTAEFVVNNSAKGKLIGVVGNIKTSTFDKKDGTRGYKTEVYAEDVEILEWKNQEGQASGQQGFSKAQNTYNDGFNDYIDVTDSENEIPF